MSTSISIKELKELDPSSYQIVDIRDAVEISHGAIPGALAMKTEEIETSDAIDRTKKTIICCSRGRFSVAAAEELQDRKKKFIHVQKNRRNAGAGENADPVKRALSETRLLDVTGGAEDFQPSGHLQPV